MGPGTVAGERRDISQMWSVLWKLQYVYTLRTCNPSCEHGGYVLNISSDSSSVQPKFPFYAGFRTNKLRTVDRSP